MLSNDMKIFRNNDIPVVTMGEELSMLDVETGKYFVLNSMGAEIWHKLETPYTIGELITIMLNEYDIDENKCATAIKKYLTDMEKQNLIKIEG